MSMKLHPIYIIAAALHVSILIYVGIAYFLANANGWTMDWRVDPDKAVILYALAAAAFMSAALALMAPRIFFKDPQAAQETPLFFDFSQVTPRIQTATILRMALAESVAIYGLVLAFLNQSFLVIVPFAVVGVFLQFLVGPFKSVLTGK